MDEETTTSATEAAFDDSYSDSFDAEGMEGMAIPVVMASWLDKEFSISQSAIKALGSITLEKELETETNDDKEGSSPTKTSTYKLQQFSVDFKVTGYAGVDVREEFESWCDLVGQYGPFYLGIKRWGPDNVQLLKVSLSETTLNDWGDILVGKITCDFQEFAPEASKDKETPLTSGKNVKTAVVNLDDTEVESAVDIGASAEDKEKMAQQSTQLEA